MKKYPLRSAVWPFAVGGLVLAILLLLIAENYRSRHSIAQPMLPVSFDHIDHTDTQCTECHHNFIDETGGGTCYNCHKYTPAIASEIEKMFHDLCFSCHVTKRLEGEDSGPMRECGACHPS